MKRTLAATAGTIAMIGGSAFMAAPAQAAPLFTGGLVNLTITDTIDGDVLSDNNVAVGAALGLAANVCDTNVNVLVADFRDAGSATCTSDAGDQRIDITQAS